MGNCKSAKPGQGGTGGSRINNSRGKATNESIETFGQPKSQMVFRGDDDKAVALGDPNQYVPTKTIHFESRETGNRQEDYANEYNSANKSKLLEKKELLT